MLLRSRLPAPIKTLTKACTLVNNRRIKQTSISCQLSPGRSTYRILQRWASPPRSRCSPQLIITHHEITQQFSEIRWQPQPHKKVAKTGSIWLNIALDQIRLAFWKRSTTNKPLNKSKNWNKWSKNRSERMSDLPMQLLKDEKPFRNKSNLLRELRLMRCAKLKQLWTWRWVSMGDQARLTHLYLLLKTQN